jgi:MFS family permease
MSPVNGRFGRKLIFVAAIVMMSLTGVAQAVAANYVTFQVFVFANALGTAGVYPLAFIIGKLQSVSSWVLQQGGHILSLTHQIYRLFPSSNISINITDTTSFWDRTGRRLHA